jgi:hypothetical protein
VTLDLLGVNSTRSGRSCRTFHSEVNMDTNEDGDILRALEDIRQLLERIADATERLASCVGSEYPRLRRSVEGQRQISLGTGR